MTDIGSLERISLKKSTPEQGANQIRGTLSSGAVDRTVRKRSAQVCRKFLPIVREGLDRGVDISHALSGETRAGNT
ncbi:MAG: hypothetical protein SF339_00150 [Blastocatellia bacterium]|nr:hypothetical protein [Blastocatellia bacterium]